MPATFSSLPPEVTERIAEHLDRDRAEWLFGDRNKDLFSLRLVNQDTAAKILRTYQRIYYTRALFELGDEARVREAIAIANKGNLMKHIRMATFEFSRQNMGELEGRQDFNIPLLVTWFCQLKAMGVSLDAVELRDFGEYTDRALPTMLVVQAIFLSGIQVRSYVSEVGIPVHEILGTFHFRQAVVGMVQNLTSLSVKAWLLMSSNRHELASRFTQILVTAPNLRELNLTDGSFSIPAPGDLEGFILKAALVATFPALNHLTIQDFDINLLLLKEFKKKNDSVNTLTLMEVCLDDESKRMLEDGDENTTMATLTGMNVIHVENFAVREYKNPELGKPRA